MRISDWSSDVCSSDLRFQGAGPAHLQVIGEALKRFRTAGKPIYAYATAYMDPGYYLASYANEVWMAPLGGVLLTGPGGPHLYFNGLIETPAINVKVSREGAFKSEGTTFKGSKQTTE